MATIEKSDNLSSKVEASPTVKLRSFDYDAKLRVLRDSISFDGADDFLAATPVVISQKLPKECRIYDAKVIYPEIEDGTDATLSLSAVTSDGTSNAILTSVNQNAGAATASFSGALDIKNAAGDFDSSQLQLAVSADLTADADGSIGIEIRYVSGNS